MFGNNSGNQSRGWFRFLSQVTWGALLVFHLVLLVSGLGDDSRGLGAQLALFVSTVFFGLKLLDVPFLRLRSARRAIILYVIVTALVHHDARAAIWDRPEGGPEVAMAVVTAVVGGLMLARARDLILGSPELENRAPRARKLPDHTVRPSYLEPWLLVFLPRPPPARLLP